MMSPEERINRILDAADSSLPVLRQSFLKIISEIRNEYYNDALINLHLSNGDVEKAIEASGILEIDPMSYGSGIDKDEPSLINQLQTIFSLGAILALSELGPEGKKASFDVLGERAVYFLRIDLPPYHNVPVLITRNSKLVLKIPATFSQLRDARIMPSQYMLPKTIRTSSAVASAISIRALIGSLTA